MPTTPVPPRPPPRPREQRAPEPLPAIAPPPLDIPVELDAPTQKLLSDAIAKAIAEQLGRVRISSVPPPKGSSTSPPPPSSRIRASMRAAAGVGSIVARKGGKVAIFASGVLSLAGSTIVWLAKPEYAAPLAQAAKLIAQVILAAAGGGTPTGD